MTENAIQTIPAYCPHLRMIAVGVPELLGQGCAYAVDNPIGEMVIHIVNKALGLRSYGSAAMGLKKIFNNRQVIFLNGAVLLGAAHLFMNRFLENPQEIMVEQAQGVQNFLGLFPDFARVLPHFIRNGAYQIVRIPSLVFRSLTTLVLGTLKVFATSKLALGIGTYAGAKFLYDSQCEDYEKLFEHPVAEARKKKEFEIQYLEALGSTYHEELNERNFLEKVSSKPTCLLEKDLLSRIRVSFSKEARSFFKIIQDAYLETLK